MVLEFFQATFRLVIIKEVEWNGSVGGGGGRVSTINHHLNMEKERRQVDILVEGRGSCHCKGPPPKRAAVEGQSAHRHMEFSQCLQHTLIAGCGSVVVFTTSF